MEHAVLGLAMAVTMFVAVESWEGWRESRSLLDFGFFLFNCSTFGLALGVAATI